MPDSDAPSLLPRLTDMNLRIGQAVQVILHGPQDYKHFTKLIGFVEPEYVILQMPMENGWAVPVTIGQALTVRFFSEVSLFEFQARIQALQLHPRNFMVVDYPSTVQETRYRDHERVTCNLPTRIVASPLGQPVGFCITDLSGSGAALVGPQALGHKGASLSLELEFRLNATDQLERLQMPATVQSVEPVTGGPVGSSTQYRHGLRFDHADPRVFLLVYELLKKRN